LGDGTISRNGAFFTFKNEPGRLTINNQNNLAKLEFINSNPNIQEIVDPYSEEGSYKYKIGRADQNKIGGCYLDAQLDCLEEAIKLFYDSDQVNICNSKCPIECNQVIFDTQISACRYPSDWYGEKLKESKSYSSVIENSGLTKSSMSTLENETVLAANLAQVLSVNIYFESLGYDNLFESSKLTFEEVLAAVGGNAGLFVGISVLSVVELIEVGYIILIIIIIALLPAKLIKLTKRSSSSFQI
jgi:hypothetical protein